MVALWTNGDRQTDDGHTEVVRTTGSTALGVAVTLTVIAGVGVFLLLLFLLFGNGYECPTVTKSGAVEPTIAIQGWWPVGMTCVTAGVRLGPDWGLTVLLLLGLTSAICSIPLWVSVATRRRITTD